MSRLGRAHPWGPAERGQATVEAALILPVIVLALFMGFAAVILLVLSDAEIEQSSTNASTMLDSDCNSVRPLSLRESPERLPRLPFELAGKSLLAFPL